MDMALQHHGVLGMKWGVHRTPAKLLRSKSTTKKSNNPSVKNVKDMSDEELRKAVNRLQMERQYSQLSSNNINKGKEYAQKLFKAGTTVAAVSTTALTIYNNADKINGIIEKVVKK